MKYCRLDVHALLSFNYITANTKHHLSGGAFAVSTNNYILLQISYRQEAPFRVK